MQTMPQSAGVTPTTTPGAPVVDLNHFREYGYVLLRKLFGADEMKARRAALEAAKQRLIAAGQYRTEPTTPNARFLYGDVFTMTELRPYDYVLFDKRIVDAVHQILGPKLVYWGDSSVQTGEGLRGFHKDNVDRYDASAPDWQGDYTIVRCGIYFQDHSRYSGGLKVRQRSHNYATHKKGKMVDIGTQVGDVLIWSLRTTHSGNNVRVRGLSNICLHPRIEQKIPHWLRVPEQYERVSMFGSFGAPSSHLERYVSNMVKRGDYDEYFRFSGYSPEFERLAAERGVEFRRPVPFYAEKYKA